MIGYFKSLRPTQWLKNLMLFFPPFLGGQLFQPGVAIKGIIPFGAFCLVSSAGYLLNDIQDRDRDACHPRKCQRPIAAGTVCLSGAIMLAVSLLAGGLLLGVRISPLFFVLLLSYAALSVSYSLFFKTLPLFDIFCIATGFILRLQAGSEAFHVVITSWLFLCVFLLAVFLSTGKRLSESRVLGNNAANCRKSLASYPPGFLEGTMYMTGGAVLVTYAMYTVSKHSLLYSVPLCLFGLLRFIFRVQSGLGGDPTESLIKDRPLFVVGLLWALIVAWGIYA